MVELLDLNICFVDADIVRLHIGGDFYSQTYFDAWLQVAAKHPDKLFYAYTKALPYWLARIGDIPNNFKLIASKGGIHDELIKKFKLRSAEVVYSVDEAEAKGLKIDHDDTLAYKGNESFALLIHGAQPAGSIASVALSHLRKEGLGGYTRDRDSDSKLFAEAA
jgi:hypothetical protein